MPGRVLNIAMSLYIEEQHRWFIWGCDKNGLDVDLRPFMTRIMIVLFWNFLWF